MAPTAPSPPSPYPLASEPCSPAYYTAATSTTADCSHCHATRRWHAPFTDTEEAEEIRAEQEDAAPRYDLSQFSAEQQAYLATLSSEELQQVMTQYGVSPMEEEVKISSSTYEENLRVLGVWDEKKPSGITIYPRDFDAKESICSTTSRIRK